jgi:hypothetical protein
MILLLSCGIKKAECQIRDFKEVNLWPVNASLKLPPFRIVDSMSFDKKTILSYNIKSLDSLIDVVAFVESHEEYLPADLDIDQQMLFQKKEVEYGRKAQKLKEEFVNIGIVKVGYLKYFIDQKDKKFYEGRLLFYRGKKLVIIWLFEKYANDEQNTHSIIDSIAGSLQLN